MWATIFDRIVSRLAFDGELHVTFPDGRRVSYGQPGTLAAGLNITDAATLRRLCLQPDLGLGEGYMNGTVIVDDDDIETLLRLLVRARRFGQLPGWVTRPQRLRSAMQPLLLRNTSASARANVAHHYDISDDLYRRFLDADMQYSCAYFTEREMPLEDAQAAKKAHIGRKLRIEPGMRVLDIGCGWGGMAMTLARDFGAYVTGITLSQNQHATAQRRARDAGLEAQTDFRLMDYRDLTERFDRVVSVGMLEHVGPPHYGEYFDKLAALMEPDGVALIHTIGKSAPPAAVSQWLTKYIFPGGYIPSLSQLAVAIEKAGLWTYDIEVLRLHYAWTLRHWLARFDDNLGWAQATYDARFIRMWRYYLIACIITFEEDHQAVFQFQLGREIGAVPLTRDYLYRSDPAG